MAVVLIAITSAAAQEQPPAPPEDPYSHGPIPDGPLVLSEPRGRYASPVPVPRSLEIPGLIDGLPAITAPPVSRAQLLAEDAESVGRNRVGIVLPVEFRSEVNGQWVQLADGAWIWLLKIVVPDARWTRVVVEPWRPVLGGALLVFDAQRRDHIHGPYRIGSHAPEGRLWSPILFSDEICIEWYVPPGMEPLAPEVQLVVTSIVHGYRGFGQDGAIELGELPCHTDVNCVPEFAFEKQGVAIYMECDGLACTACSGVMVTRHGGDFTPLFLTAARCAPVLLPNGVAIWGFHTDTCNGTVPDLATLPQTQMIWVLANDEDVTLLGLAEDLPAGVAFLVWDTSAYTESGTAATVIHHPAESFKRISEGRTSAFDLGGSFSYIFGGCTAGLNKLLDFSDSFGFGRLEGGSGGGPVFDGSEHIRAIVACTSLFVSCDGEDSASIGRLSAAEPGLRPYFDPVNPIYVEPNYLGYQRGTASQPLSQFVNGLFATLRGGTLYVSPGYYADVPILNKAMVITRWPGQSGSVVLGVR